MGIMEGPKKVVEEAKAKKAEKEAREASAIAERGACPLNSFEPCREECTWFYGSVCSINKIASRLEEVARKR